MKIKAIIYPILAILIGSCEKSFLQRNNPNNIAEDLFYQNEQDATLGLYGVYDALQNNQLYGNFFNLLDEISDNGTNGNATNGFREMEESAHTPLNVRIQNIYTHLYNVVRQANYVIAKVGEMNSGQISDAAKSRIIAEASVLRALAYFHLVNLYRDVPFYTESVTAFTEGKGPTSRADIYKFLKEDLAKNISALPAVIPPNEAGRTGRAAAIALLGKVHLFDHEFDKASAQLGRLFDSQFQLALYPDYTTLFLPYPEAEFSSEILLQVNFVNDGAENGENFSLRIDPAAQPIKPRQYFTPNAALVNSYLYTDGRPFANSDLYGTRSPLYVASGPNRYRDRDPRLRASVL
ncbi:MAG TPA: RagB/SusD family nutrient uptake outer membrane protein, partial [Sphingobacterium sp.]|nr:RagB/SusD family nutrient uptake outer membrane protein [Sphingobacterium sp.]